MFDIRRLFSRKSNGTTRWKLKPVPVMPARFTLGQLEAVCALLDLDVDLFMNGEMTFDELEAPKLKDAQALLQILCENGDKYDVRAWTPSQYEAVFATLFANFLMRLAIS